MRMGAQRGDDFDDDDDGDGAVIGFIVALAVVALAAFIALGFVAGLLWCGAQG